MENGKIDNKKYLEATNEIVKNLFEDLFDYEYNNDQNINELIKNKYEERTK